MILRCGAPRAIRPKGVNIPAQGNALGLENGQTFAALKGRNNAAASKFVLPFQGDDSCGHLVSQGVALGWHVLAPSGRRHSRF
jgi:hypothetical protein